MPSILDLNEDCLLLLAQKLSPPLPPTLFCDPRIGLTPDSDAVSAHNDMILKVLRDKVALTSTCRFLRNFLYSETCSGIWKDLAYLGTKPESFVCFLPRVAGAIETLEINLSQYMRKCACKFLGCEKPTETELESYFDYYKFNTSFERQVDAIFKDCPVLPNLTSLNLTPYLPHDFGPKALGVKLLPGFQCTDNQTLIKLTAAFPLLEEATGGFFCDYDASSAEANQLLIDYLRSKDCLTSVALPEHTSADVIPKWLTTPADAERLTKLDLPCLRDSDVSVVVTCSNLKSLVADGMAEEFTDAGLALLGGLYNLRRLEFTCQHIRFSADALKSLFENASFSLRNFLLGPIFAPEEPICDDDALRALISHNPELEEIFLFHCPVSTEGFRDVNTLSHLLQIICAGKKLDSSILRLLDPESLPKFESFTDYSMYATDEDKHYFLGRFPNATVSCADRPLNDEEDDSDFEADEDGWETVSESDSSDADGSYHGHGLNLVFDGRADNGCATH